jgi:hypothetical protein
MKSELQRKERNVLREKASTSIKAPPPLHRFAVSRNARHILKQYRTPAETKRRKDVEKIQASGQ